MTWNLSATVALTEETCWACGITFAMPTNHANWCRDNGKNFYCPKGCCLRYGESTVDKLTKQLAQEKHAREQEAARLRNRIVEEQEAAQRIELRRRAAVGQVTKIRKRVGNGVCPCCKRTFTDLQRHMHTKHPDWAPEADHA